MGTVMWPPPQSWYRILLAYQKAPSWSFVLSAILPLDPGSPWSAFSRISCNWNYTIYNLLFWPLLLSIMLLRLRYIVNLQHSFFLFITEYYSTVCIYVILFTVHQFRLGYQFGAIMSQVVLNIQVQICVSISFYFSWINT